MGFCRAFFGDLNDWLHQNHHFFSEPSGNSKTKVLFQVVNIVQVAEHVYLPLGDEQNDFIVKTFERVKTSSEFLEKLKVANIERMRGGEIEKVVETWKKPKHIPFYFSQPLKKEQEKFDPNLIELDKLFEDNNTPVDISLVLITESNGNNETEVVAADGSQATSLLLFVRPTNQPESEEAVSLNQQTTLSSTIGPSHSVPSTSASKEKSFRSPVRLFTKNMNQIGWIVDDAPSLNKLVKGARCVLSQPPAAEEFKIGWQLMLAHLLKKCDEEIEKNKKKFDALMSEWHQSKTHGDRWNRIKDTFDYYLKKNSETFKSSNPDRPIFLRPSVKFYHESTDQILRWILCGRKRVDDLLGVPFYGTNNPLACPYYPDCRVICTSADLKPLHLLSEHRDDVLASLECPICEKSFKNKNSIYTHIYKHAKKLGLKMGQKRKPRDEVPKLVECPICHLCYKNKGSLATHMWRDHEKLKSDQKRKPEESVFAAPEAKRTSQVQSHQHSYPSVSPPKDQHSDLYDLLESVTATTSYNSSMPYSDRLKPVIGYQEENSKIPSPKSTDLPIVSEEDFTIEEVDACMDEIFRSITQNRVKRSFPTHQLSYPSVSSQETHSTTSYNSGMPDHSVLGQQENSKIPLSLKSTDLPNPSVDVLSEDDGMTFEQYLDSIKFVN